MRKSIQATALGLLLSVAFLVNAGQHAGQDEQTSGSDGYIPRAYVSFTFGNERTLSQQFPQQFQYGLRLDQHHGNAAGLPPLAQLDFTPHGFRSARLNGVEFNPLRPRLYETGESGGGYSLADWGLLAVGVVGLGYTAAKATGKSSTESASNTDGGGGGGCTPTPPLPTCLTRQDSQYGRFEDSENTVERQPWLDSGTGQMGDLKR